MSQNSWDETTISSSIYSELNDFLEETKDLEKEELSERLKEKINAAYEQKKFDFALLWLNEYQFLNKNDVFADEYEKKLEAWYNETLAAANRPCSLFKSEPSAYLNIESLKDRYAGERCFIIGNGPSLNKVDLTKLKNEFTFGVNSIFLARDKMGFDTTFYCVEDTHVANDRKQEIQSINSPVKFYGHYLKKNILPHPNNVFLNILLDYRRYIGFPYFSVDASRRLWVGGSVSYVNMQLAYYMGFKNVYLIGFDHEYTIPSSAIVKGADIKSTMDDPNHFHPDYFGKGYNWHVPLVNRMELGYLKARRAFEIDGREIVNITPGGQLEVFRRDDYDKVLAEDYTPAKGPEDIKNYVKALVVPPQVEDVKISVVVPCYNVEDCLTDTLNSLEAQSFKGFEIIIVNDGSTDSTLEVAENYAKHFPNIRVISQENKGLGGARNTGLRNSRGKYCTFVDSDDLLKPDTLLNLYNEAEKTKADIVQCGYERSQDGKTLKSVTATVDMTGYNAIQQMATAQYFSAWAKLYRIEFLNEHNLCFEDHVYHEDIEFAIKAHYFAKTARVIPYIGYVWIIRDGSITSSMQDKHIEDVSHILGNLKEFYIKEGFFDRYHRKYYALCYRLFYMILLRLYNEPDLWKRTLLLRTFRRELERNDLDHYEYIWEANSTYKFTPDVLRKSFLLDMKITPPAKGKPAPAKAAPKPAPASNKSNRKLKKFFTNPYAFFADSKGAARHFKYLFFPWKSSKK